MSEEQATYTTGSTGEEARAGSQQQQGQGSLAGRLLRDRENCVWKAWEEGVTWWC